VLNIRDQRAQTGDGPMQLWNARSLFDVARLIGDALRVRLHRRIEGSAPHVRMQRTQRGEGMRRSFGQLPGPDGA
jgi:predicted proteasome-type protease